MRRLQWESSCHRSRGSRAGRLSAYPREVIFPQSQLLEPLREQLGRRNFVGVELCEKHLVYCVRFEHVIHEAAARCEPASELEVATDDRLGERAPHFRYEAAPGRLPHLADAGASDERHAGTHCTPRGRSVLRRSLRLVALVAEDTAEPPGVCVDQRRGHRRPERVVRILCTSSNASSVVLEQRFKSDRVIETHVPTVPLEAAGRETCMKESSSTSRARWCT